MCLPYCISRTQGCTCQIRSHPRKVVVHRNRVAAGRFRNSSGKIRRSQDPLTSASEIPSGCRLQRPAASFAASRHSVHPMHNSFIYLLFSILMLLLNILNLVSQLPRYLDEVWHRELHQTSSPCQLHHLIRSQLIVASVQANCEKFLLLLTNKELQQLIHQLGVLRFLRRLDCVSVHLVLLA